MVTKEKFLFHFLHFLSLLPKCCPPLRNTGFMWPNLLDLPRAVLKFPLGSFQNSNWVILFFFVTGTTVSWPEPHLPLCHLYYFQNKPLAISLNPIDFVLHAVSSLWNIICPPLKVQILPFFQSPMKKHSSPRSPPRSALIWIILSLLTNSIYYLVLS